MKSWWDLGEGIGQSGEALATYMIECPFCGESGNWAQEHHAEKNKPNSDKKLNFDTLKCGNCAGYVMVLWSASEYGHGHGLHSFRVLPWPLKIGEAPEHWPTAVKRGWAEAQSSLKAENWNSAAVMARTAMQAALRDHQATGSNLMQEIESLAQSGLLPPLMVDWSHEVRELGNDSTHMEPDDEGTEPDDANDIVEFLDYLLEYLYELPKRIESYRERRANREAQSQE